MTKADVKATSAIWLDDRARASRSALKAIVQVANSAKKLRLTKVDAGLGPCGKYLKSIQNCRAVHSDATTTPQ